MWNMTFSSDKIKTLQLRTVRAANPYVCDINLQFVHTWYRCWPWGNYRSVNTHKHTSFCHKYASFHCCLYSSLLRTVGVDYHTHDALEPRRRHMSLDKVQLLPRHPRHRQLLKKSLVMITDSLHPKVFILILSKWHYAFDMIGMLVMTIILIGWHVNLTKYYGVFVTLFFSI